MLGPALALRLNNVTQLPLAVNVHSLRRLECWASTLALQLSNVTQLLLVVSTCAGYPLLSHSTVAANLATASMLHFLCALASMGVWLERETPLFCQHGLRHRRPYPLEHWVICSPTM